LYLSVVFSVGFSRLYNGVHSIDQIIDGAVLGAYVAVLCHVFVKNGLYTVISDMIYSSRVKSIQDYSKIFLIFFIPISVLTGILLAFKHY
jgi:hypothetical protein